MRRVTLSSASWLQMRDIVNFQGSMNPSGILDAYPLNGIEQRMDYHGRNLT